MSSIDEAVAATPSVESDENTKQPLNSNNYLNFIAFALNITLVYGIGNGGWIGTPTNGELSDKYQTLVTPNSTAFSIWGVIYLAQGAFAVLQFMPRFRAHPMLQDGLGHWYSVAVAMQIGWTFAFAFEVIPLSIVFMLLIWVSLMTIVYRQYYTQSDGSFLEFWVLRFPFSVHAGWITAASALNVNVQVVSMDTPADVQLAVAIVSLAVLHAISVWVVFYIPRPNWTIACVLSWAFGWIYNELGEPLELITNTFSPDTINGVRYAAISVVCVIGIQMVVRLGLLLVPSWNPYRNDVSRIESASLVESGAELKV